MEKKEKNKLTDKQIRELAVRSIERMGICDIKLVRMTENVIHLKATPVFKYNE